MSKNISILCKVIENKGNTFLETESGGELVAELVIETNKGKVFNLKLKDIWSKASDYVWAGAELLLHYVKIDRENNHLIIDIEGYLVLEPDILVSPSAIRNSEGCIRKYYVQKRIGVTEKNYPMLRGTLVNNSFDLLIEKKLNKKEITEKVLNDMLIELSSIDEQSLPEHQKIKGDLEQHLNALVAWKTHKKFLESDYNTTEPTFLSRKYGLSGRLDLLVNPGKEAVTYELKTGKSPDTQPWRNDIYQVACYQLLLESAYECVNPDSYVIYSQGKANDLLKQCSIDFKTRRQVINVRNQIVSIDYALLHDLHKEPEILKLIPPTESGNCDRCLLKTECFYICRILKEKECISCGMVKSCNEIHKFKSKDILYYEKYFRLVEIERNESRKNFSRIFNDIESVLMEGKAIMDLEFVSINEKLLELKSNSVIEAEIKPGDLILLFNEKITKGEVFKASVKHIDRFDVRVQIKKDIPTGFFEGKTWNIYVDTMETSFETMNGALLSFLSEKNSEKRDLILGRKKPRFNTLQEVDIKPDLNSMQKHAIKKALSAEDYFLIQGPPGTGKTHTLANLIIELVKRGKRVLLSAFTHRSIDNVLLKIIEEGFTDFLRIGAHEIVDPEIHPYLIQERFKNYSFQDLKTLQKELERYPVMACSSISSMSSALIRRLPFDVAVVDEAGQLTEPGTLSIILQAKKFILVGDHKQLPPVIQSTMAKNMGLDKSLFERLIEMNKENLEDVLVTLSEQYRMNEKIMEFSNRHFYDFALKAHDKIARQQLKFSNEDFSDMNEIFLPEYPLIFVNINTSSSNKTNSEEAKIMVNLARRFTEYGIKPEKIGIITPFRSQVAEIKRAFLDKNGKRAENITIDTVDRFQGSDRDIIMFSSVISKFEHITDFYKDFRRINVTVTRAKKKFILVGNKEVLVKSDLFNNLLGLSKEISYLPK